jgi:hypothetical protein
MSEVIIPLTGALYDDEDDAPVEAEVDRGNHAEWGNPEEYLQDGVADASADDPDPEPEPEADEPLPPAENQMKDMGTYPMARSADGVVALNTLEILTPFELSV